MPPSHTEQVLDQVAELTKSFGKFHADRYDVWIPIYYNFTAAQVVPLPLFAHDVWIRTLVLGGAGGGNYVFITTLNETAQAINTNNGPKREVLAVAYVSNTGVPASPWTGIVRIPKDTPTWISIFAAGTVHVNLSHPFGSFG